MYFAIDYMIKMEGEIIIEDVIATKGTHFNISRALIL
jgi:predicted RNA-binding protein